MAEIKHTQLSKWLKETAFSDLPPVYLVHGESFLCRNVFDHILDALLPRDQRSLGYDFLDGDEAKIPVMVERLSTYSMMQDRLVVAAKEVPLFSTDRQSGMVPTDLEALQNLMQKGLPPGHYLLLTTSQADRRRTLFKTFKTCGLVVDCTVAGGSRKADKTEQAVLLRSLMEEVLAPVQKGIDGQAFNLLTDRVGFDPATLVDNLEKLVAFIGPRPGITVMDVQTVVERTRKDAIFEFTNAVADRNAPASLFYFHSLTQGGIHPLQFLKALTNQIRKLTRVKGFIDDCQNSGKIVWHPGQSYQQFTRSTLPAVVKADELMVKKLKAWEDERPQGDGAMTAGRGTVSGRKKAAARKKRSASDLTMAPNPKNPYPVYQSFLKSDNFTQKEFIYILMALGDLDFRLKSATGHPHVLLENLIVRICTGLPLV